MKYAIYDKAADGYLTKMEFKVGYSEHTQLECGYTERITDANLLYLPKEAADAIARIESCKFMDKGRFVVHSFDDTLKDQYIISKAGEPTKVVDNITVDLNGAISVKYGTMAFHWSTGSLEYAIVRMNALQKAKDSRYTAWCNTFDIYKVITVIDEKSCSHYQFIKVTEKGLSEYSKKEIDPLNKRIEELEKVNHRMDNNVNYHNECRVALADMIRAIKYAICSKDSDKRANYISYMTDRIKDDEIFNRPELKTAKNDIPRICKHLAVLSKDSLSKRIEELEKALDDQKKLNDINKATIARMVVEKRAMNKELSDAADALKEVNDKNEGLANMLKEITDSIADIMLATRTTDYDKMVSDLTDVSLKMGIKTIDDGPMYGISVILTTFIRSIKERAYWERKSMKVEKALDNQKKLNEAFNDTIVRYRNDRWDIDKENHELRVTRGCLAEVTFAIRNAICNNNSDAFDCIINRMALDRDFNSNPFMAGVRENIKDICTAEKRNIANHELKNSEIARLTEERDIALERAEKLKGIANSVYGMAIPGRCCGKQVMADIFSGKKIPISKDKYDSILTSLKLIDMSYEGVYGTMIQISPKPKPTWLPGLMNELKNLTE